MMEDLPPALRIISFDSSDLHGADKFELWREFTSRGIIGLGTSPIGSPSEFNFATSAVVGEGFATMAVQASACRIQRDPGKYQDHWSDTVVVNFVKSGRLLVEQDGRSTVVGVGDGAICDANRPYSIQLDSAFQGTIVKFSRRLLSPGVDFDQATALSLVSASGVAGLLHNYANNLAQAAAMLDPTTGHRLMRIFVDTLETALAPVRREATWGRGGYRKATLSRVSQFLNARLQDPELTPGRVSELLKLPPRYLHKLFAEQGTTVGRYIRDGRLDRSAAALIDPAYADQSVTEIALRSGFKDLGHFSRSFRTRFGLAPSDYRTRRGSAMPPESVKRVLTARSW